MRAMLGVMASQTSGLAMGSTSRARVRAMLADMTSQTSGRAMGSTSRARDRGSVVPSQAATSGYGRSGLAKKSRRRLKGLAATHAARAGITVEDSDDFVGADGAEEGIDEQDDAIDIEATLEDMMRKTFLENVEKKKKKKSTKKRKMKVEQKKKKKNGGSPDEDISSSNDASSSSQEKGGQDGNRGNLEDKVSRRRDYRKHP